jgi:uncharacterized SAM-binding protein YcdF (DUF218 family)
MPIPQFNRFIQRQSVWWPTLLGWISIFVFVSGGGLLWWFNFESFLSRTDRLPADTLIVEGWIGVEGVRAAKAEFEQGRYRYIVTVGALTDNRWGPQRWNYATEAAELLVRLGVPSERVIESRSEETVAQRTFASAVAARQNLSLRGIKPAKANVFTRGVHARRSRLLFAKVLGPETEVGAISWTPASAAKGPWWHSTERADDLLKETAGYLYELLLNSGRFTNHP